MTTLKQRGQKILSGKHLVYTPTDRFRIILDSVWNEEKQFDVNLNKHTDLKFIFLG